ncbi:ATPase [Bacillus cereus]|uniref:ATPase n=1 Tax=Bacillus cereus TaxID=1396 RepID=UPI0018F693E3|nr:ATPase [Bacillus cereus]MBJ8093143.1 ATPase [Bacillus cereus]
MNEICVNDKVEVISKFNPELYEKVGTVIKKKNSSYGVEARVVFNDGYETWIDFKDLSIISEK